jgi:hypothetical protein
MSGVICQGNKLTSNFVCRGIGFSHGLAMSHICANDEVGVTNRPENIVIRYVSVVSLSLSSIALNCKVVDGSLRLRADISKVTAHEIIPYL